MILFLMLVGGACFVNADSAEVVLIDDIGSFSGAILRIESPVNGDIGDKVYASEYLTQVGIIKFDIDTSLDEVLLNFVVMKSGLVVGEFQSGPFVVNGSEILVDRRKRVEVVQETVEPIVENSSNKSESVDDEVIESLVGNESADFNKTLEEEVVDGIVDGNVFFLFLIGGILTFIILMVAWFKFETFRDWMVRLNYFSEDGELARIEARIKRKYDLMDRLKEKKARKRKIKLMSKKLERENKKLEKMIKKKVKKKFKK